jgi:hypothetical protein
MVGQMAGMEVMEAASICGAITIIGHYFI